MFVPFARQTIRQMGLSHTLDKLLSRWIASSELFRTVLSTCAATIILLMHVSGFSNLFCPFKVAIYGRLLKKNIQEKSRSREESHCKNGYSEGKKIGVILTFAQFSEITLHQMVEAMLNSTSSFHASSCANPFPVVI